MTDVNNAGSRPGDIPTEEDQKILDNLAKELPEKFGTPQPEVKEEPPKEEAIVPEEPKVEETPKEVEVEEPKPKRDFRAIPIPKYQEEKSKWREEKARLEEEREQLRAELDKVKDSIPQDTDLEVKNLAEEYGVDEKFVKKLVNLTTSKTKIPKELTEQMEAAYADKRFNDEFDGLIKEFPELDDSTHKANFKKLAMVEEPQTPFRTLAIKYKFDNAETFKPKKKSAETGAPGSTRSSDKVMDYDSVTNVEIANMSPLEVEKYSQYMIEKEKRTNVR